MDTFSNSIIFWSGVAAFAAVAAAIINFAFRRIVDRSAFEQSRYRHRIANQLPRWLHKEDHDEMLELTNSSQRYWSRGG